MTPEGYKQIKEPLGGALVEPEPKEGEDVSFVRVITARPEIVLDALLKAQMLIHDGVMGSYTRGDRPRLKRVHMYEKGSILFQDLDANTQDS